MAKVKFNLNAALWELAKFKRPTHQVSFHTARALAALEFLKGYEADYGV